jgi:hypothetical protein
MYSSGFSLTPANSAADPVRSGQPFLYAVAHRSAVWKIHYGRTYSIVAFATLLIYLRNYLFIYGSDIWHGLQFHGSSNVTKEKSGCAVLKLKKH